MDSVLRILQQKGVLASKAWLQQCVEYLQITGGATTNTQLLAEKVFSCFLFANLYDVVELYEGALPLSPAVHQKHNEMLGQSDVLLQIIEFKNVGSSAVSTGENKDSSSGNRMYKLLLTDGRNLFVGYEVKIIPALSPATVAGCKILIKASKCEVKHGILLLNPTNLQVLGGSVEHFENLQNRMYPKASASNQQSVPVATLTRITSENTSNQNTNNIQASTTNSTSVHNTRPIESVGHNLQAPTYNQQQQPMVSRQYEAPTYNQQKQQPIASRQHEAPTYNQQQQQPMVSRQHEAPTYNQQQQQPMVSRQHEAPTYSQQQQQPMVSRQHEAPTYNHQQQPIASRQYEAPTYNHQQQPIASRQYEAPTYNHQQQPIASRDYEENEVRAAEAVGMVRHSLPNRTSPIQTALPAPSRAPQGISNNNSVIETIDLIEDSQPSPKYDYVDDFDAPYYHQSAGEMDYDTHSYHQPSADTELLSLDAPSTIQHNTSASYGNMDDLMLVDSAVEPYDASGYNDEAKETDDNFMYVVDDTFYNESDDLLPTPPTVASKVNNNNEMHHKLSLNDFILMSPVQNSRKYVVNGSIEQIKKFKTSDDKYTLYALFHDSTSNTDEPVAISDEVCYAVFGITAREYNQVIANKTKAAALDIRMEYLSKFQIFSNNYNYLVRKRVTCENSENCSGNIMSIQSDSSGKNDMLNPIIEIYEIL